MRTCSRCRQPTGSKAWLCNTCQRAYRDVWMKKKHGPDWQPRHRWAPEGMRRCTGCGELLALESFRIIRKGTTNRSYDCNECHRLANRERSRRPDVAAKLSAQSLHRYETKARMVYDYLLEHPCVDCGEKDPIVLDFDHRDPKDKHFAIAKGVGKHVTTERLLTEMAKCDVRCANCHRRKTARENGSRRYQWGTERNVGLPTAEVQ